MFFHSVPAFALRINVRNLQDGIENIVKNFTISYNGPVQYQFKNGHSGKFMFALYLILQFCVRVTAGKYSLSNNRY